MIEANGLSKSFKQHKRKKKSFLPPDPRERGRLFEALQEVTFRAENGTITGLLGPNGAGKTTLLRILATALRPSAGTAAIDGMDIVRHPLEVRRRIGFLSGGTGLYGRLTAREMIEYFGRLHSVPAAVIRQRIAEFSRLLEMEGFLDKRNDSLSSGMKQRVSIARTLVHDPQVLIFDEPTTGLDVAAAETILAFIRRCKEQGKTVLFSTHHMHEVDRLCDSAVVLREGRLCFQGTIPQMRAHTGQTALDQAFLTLMAEGTGHAL
jgi:sodium transport system ATP-binding protein